MVAASISISRGQNVTLGALTANIGTVDNNVYVDTLQVGPYGVDSTGTIYSLADGIDASFYELTIANLTTVGGNLSIGDGFTVGSWWDGTDFWNGLTTAFNDDYDEYHSSTYFSGASPQVEWRWQQNGAVTATNQMALDYRGNLTLTDSTSGNYIALIPSNSTIVIDWYNGTGRQSQNIPLNDFVISNTYSDAGGLMVLGNGTINLDASHGGAYQAMTLGASFVKSYFGFIITDNSTSRYITIDPSGQAIDFSNGVYLNSSSSTTQFGLDGLSLAIGSATVSGNNAFAIGSGSTATAQGAFAFMDGSVASAISSLSIGYSSNVSAVGGVALAGGNATASNAFAIGVGTVSQTWGAFVVGHYNSAISGCTTAWAAQDPALVVGVGNSTVPSNGLVILNNGNTTVSGTANFDNPDYVSPTSGTQPQELQVNGAATIGGNATFNGNITATISPGGDVLMGTFAH